MNRTHIVVKPMANGLAMLSDAQPEQMARNVARDLPGSQAVKFDEIGNTMNTTTQTTVTAEQFDALCWRKLGYKLASGFEPSVPRRFKDIESGIVCEIDRDVKPWEGRTIDNKPVTLVSVTAIFLDDVHFLLHSARQINQLQELR